MVKGLKFLLLLIPFFWACSPGEKSETSEENSIAEIKQATLDDGVWRATLALKDGVELPFNFSVENGVSSSPKLSIMNGEERLVLDDVKIWKDSIIIPMHIFDTEVVGVIEGKTIKGKWVKKAYSKPYEIPFVAQAGESYRFEDGNGLQPMDDISGKWDVAFENEGQDPSMAIGVFEQKGSRLLGTFLTTTGDYRYLEGSVVGDELKLSCFDGEHAFLFTAKLTEGVITNGKFFSGKHWEQGWSAVENSDASLPDATTLTYLKNGYDKLEFSFPNEDNKQISLADEKYKGKVVVVQLLGSWCPNCMDESKFLSPFYKKYKPEGLEIIGLAYERSPDFDVARKRVIVMKNKLELDYEVLVAGVSSKKEAAKTLPMLNHVMSFPTTIIIDRNGDVRQIHTGFSGPGTGEYYQQFVDEFTMTVKKLLEEEVSS